MQIRRRWIWLDWTLLALYLLWFVMGIVFYFGKPDELGHPSPAEFFIAFTICFGVPLLFWRPGYVHLVAFPLAVLLTTGALNVMLTYRAQVHTGLMLPLVLLVAYHSHRRTIVWWIALFVVAQSLLDPLLIRDYDPTNGLNGFVNNVILFAIGYMLRRVLESNLRMKELLWENERQQRLIEEQNRALTLYANQIEKLTLMEERNRMARELHDTVGHTFTSVVMGMDAISYLVRSAPEQAEAKLNVLREVTRKGLEEVRRNIHQIAPDDDGESLHARLSGIAGQFSLHTNTRVTVREAGEPYALPKHAHLTLVRCLQEALTNAKRHGNASRVEARLSYEPERVTLSVQDDGQGRKELRYGFGLESMKDRLAEAQGTLRVDSAPERGTLIECEIPRRAPS